MLVSIFDKIFTNKTLYKSKDNFYALNSCAHIEITPTHRESSLHYKKLLVKHLPDVLAKCLYFLEYCIVKDALGKHYIDTGFRTIKNKCDKLHPENRCWINKMMDVTDF